MWGGSTCETKIVAILGKTILKVSYLQYSLNKHEYFCHNTVIHDNLCFIVAPAQKNQSSNRVVMVTSLPAQFKCENTRSNFYYYWKPCLKPIYACMKKSAFTKILQILCFDFLLGGSSLINGEILTSPNPPPWFVDNHFQKHVVVWTVTFAPWIAGVLNLKMSKCIFLGV